MRERRMNLLKMISMLCLTVCMSIVFSVNASAAGKPVKSWKELDDSIRRQGANSEAEYLIAGDMKANKTITIDNGKKVVLTCTGYHSVKRDNAFKGTFFVVSGAGSSLSTQGENRYGFNIDGGTVAVDGRFADVQNNGTIEINKGTVISSFKSNQEGNLIYNDGGNVVLKGGNITGSDENSDIYQNGSMEIAFANKDDDRTNVGMTIYIAKANTTKITSDYYVWGKIKLDVASSIKANDVIIAVAKNINGGKFASEYTSFFEKGNGK